MPSPASPATEPQTSAALGFGVASAAAKRSGAPLRERHAWRFPRNPALPTGHVAGFL